eukprot:1142981-Pelagomonas_calceolata.AAC.1
MGIKFVGKLNGTLVVKSQLLELVKGMLNTTGPANLGLLNNQRYRMKDDKLQVTMGFDLQPGSLAAWSAQLFQLHKKYP